MTRSTRSSRPSSASLTGRCGRARRPADDYDKLTLDIETDGRSERAGGAPRGSGDPLKSMAIFTDADRLEALQAAGTGSTASPSQVTAAGGAAGPGWASADGMDDILTRSSSWASVLQRLKRAGIQTVGDLSRSRSRSERDPELRSQVDRGGHRDAEVPRPGPAAVANAPPAHRNKLSRSASPRKALFMNLAREVFRPRADQDTEAKAKAAARRSKADHARQARRPARGRQALSALGQDKFVVHKLFDEIAPRYTDRNGGYTRIQARPASLGRDRDGLY